MLTLKRNGAELVIDAEEGRIASLTDGKKEYISEMLPIFKIAFRDEKGAQSFEDSSEMKLAESEATEEALRVRYVGRKCTAEIEARVSEGIEWKMTVSPCKEFIAEWVNYPQIAVPNDLCADGYKILWGFNEGVLVDDIKKRESLFGYREPTYPSLGVSGLYPAIVETQFMAYLNGSGGLYFGAHDASDNLKGIDFYETEKGAVLLQIRHFCGGYPGTAYSTSYPTVTRFFNGSWQDAAEIYRSWFEKNKKDAFVPIAENKGLPKWYGDSPVVITYPVRGAHDMDEMTPNALFPYMNIMKHVERLEKELESKVMVLLMHWEGTAPWAPPYVWPPFGGEEELKKLISALHERGDVIGVYCSGIGWTLKSNVADYDTLERFEKEGLREEMCLSPEQELPYSRICSAQRVGYDLCPSRRFTIDTVEREVKKMASAGIDYIQLLDQNHGGTSYFCYSKKHGHPYVPGKWQVDAMKSLLAGVGKLGQGVILGCESAAAEAYAPYLLFSDNRYELNYAVGVQVPLYAYLFHEYLNNFMGNQVCVGDIFDHDASPDNIYERIAYSFSAGDMLTLVLNQYGEIAWNWGQVRTTALPDQENVKTLVRNLNRWRRNGGKKYLHTGKMTKGFEIKCGVNEYVRLGGKYDIVRDKIHTSAWISRAGSYGQFLINYNPERETVKVNVTESGCELVFADGVREPLTIGENEIEVPSFEAVLIERI